MTTSSRLRLSRSVVTRSTGPRVTGRVDQRHNGRALHSQLLRQFALRQRLVMAGDSGRPLPSWLAEAEVFSRRLTASRQ